MFPLVWFFLPLKKLEKKTKLAAVSCSIPSELGLSLCVLESLRDTVTPKKKLYKHTHTVFSFLKKKYLSKKKKKKASQCLQ